MLSSALFLLIWSVSGVLSATPTPLPASGPGVPSPNVDDPGNALLVMMGVILAVVGIVVITIGVRSARANERAEDAEQQRLMLAARAPEPPSPDDALADSRASLPASDEQGTG